MQFFRNVDIVKRYKVDESTVRKWIRGAREGKLDLALHVEGSRTYIANTTRNTTLIADLIQERRKFRNSKAAKVVRPRPEFYKIYTQSQIYELLTNLELHHEIPRQYNYFDGGAMSWDEYAQRLANEDAPNVMNRTINLLEISQSFLDYLVSGYRRVNIVDLGVGNALPVKAFLSRLLERGILGRYIALDISAEMLEIARRNIKSWFDNQVVFEGYEMDISRERFTNILAEEYLKPDADETINLVLLLGGTPYNFRNPDGVLQCIHDSMGAKDYLVHTMKLDTEVTRQYFDFNANRAKSPLPPIHRFVIDILNIDPSLYELELGFDEVRKQRYERIRFTTALTIEFEFDEGRRAVSFSKGESVLVWRSWQQTVKDLTRQFDRNDFYILTAVQTVDMEYVLTVSRAKED
ncbi:L-histidine N(alpha)-methyltransferase [Plantactinospora solaniradicis]|uniref:L-histidine N(Alpha)-methyltransferase n=1 Tax=Plantactinospora solaniradicis TaxID=1723736 RepID=A0ABW1KJA0_9ACTN